MLQNDKLSVIFASCYLFVYCILLQSDATTGYAIAMVLFFPPVLVWMLFSILKQRPYKGRQLDEEEFGYQDRDKNSLGVF